jgi:small subunit ribosomal protein S17
MPTKKKEELNEISEAEVSAAAADVSGEAEPSASIEAAAETTAETKPESSDKKAKRSASAEPAETSAAPAKHASKRAERIGIVSSDKMTKTVTVRVDRLVKHPMYRKYIKRRKKFMAHDELGARIGDKVRIVETRPLSARKRWRVVEIIQRAEL